MATERTMVQTAADTYDVSEIPPEAPEGEWTATPKATLRTSSKGNPMIVINWTLDESHDGHPCTGKQRVGDFLNFPPSDSPGYRPSVQQIAALCAHLEIPTKGTRQQLCDAIDAAGQARIWTYHQTDKVTGEVRTKITYVEPKGRAAAAAAAAEDEKPKTKNGAKKGKR